ncbi:MAG: relaxase/mobilization nuclease domain-containing protein, partial [Desulfovibrio sp.]|nr:relaxase/mobilization nuclease domain-containing protein [Desulfovibrio sp.]
MAHVLRHAHLAKGAYPSGRPKVARRFASRNSNAKGRKTKRLWDLEKHVWLFLDHRRVSIGNTLMIVKKIKHTANNKPKEWQIGDLVDYIRNPTVRNKGEKIEHAGGLNFITRTHVAQKLEMICLARETVHSIMPVNHWVFSWPEGEQPTPKQVDELVKFFLEQMGLQEHQAIYALHNDTKNYHVHIAVNRVHPETCKVVRVNNGFDIKLAQKIKTLIEQKQGWSPLENGPYVVTEEGEVAKRITPREPKPTEKAIQFEQATGEKSAQRIAQEKGHKIIKNAKSWEELHEGLKNCGRRFEKKGSGAIIWVGDTAVKASSVDRSFSMGKLVKKLGEFVAGNYEEELKIEPEPLDKATVKDLQIYQATTAELDRQRREIEERNNREKAELLVRQKTERREKLQNLLEKYGQAVFYLGAYFLRIQQKEERVKFYETLREKTPSFARPTFRAWLLNRGKVLALSEAREENRHSPPPNEQKTGPQELAFLKYAEAVNADRYRVTVIRMGEDGSRQVFILDKKNGQSMGFTPDELVKRMPELIKLQSRGENIYYTPLSE